MRTILGLTLAALLLAAAPGVSGANTSHAGWPQIDGMLLMNKLDQPRPLDGRPGADPFDGADTSYSCDGLHKSSACIPGAPPFAADTGVCDALVPALDDVCDEVDATIATVPEAIGHNELLGGHGSDVIHAGPAGDVLWGDYKPSGQPATQSDELDGGPGDDFFYASHGRNVIRTGGGVDVVHAHFGHGSITCDSRTVTVFISRRSRPHYALRGCTRISYKTLGY